MPRPMLFQSYPAALNTATPYGPYRAVLDRVIDGDTVLCWIDLGFGRYIYEPLRLAGINTPELTAADPAVRTTAVAAKDYVAKLIPPGTGVVITTTPSQEKTFERYVAKIQMVDGRDVSAVMLASGLAQVWTEPKG